MARRTNYEALRGIKLHGVYRRGEKVEYDLADALAEPGRVTVPRYALAAICDRIEELTALASQSAADDALNKQLLALSKAESTAVMDQALAQLEEMS